MNIAVCIKQTPDTTTRVQIAADGTSIVEDSISWIINPYDEFAIEEALQLTEQHGGEVTIISLGPPRVDKTIREAFAMGAHRGIRLHADAVPVDPQRTAGALVEVLKAGPYDLIFTGRQAIDDDHAQIPSRIAQAMQVPCITMVVELNVDGGQGTAVREVEGGHERVSFRLPAVVGANRHLNEPRYRSLRGRMQAKKKKIEVVDAALGAGNMVIEKLAYPPEKSASKMFDNGAGAVPDVVRLLREEAKVI